MASSVIATAAASQSTLLLKPSAVFLAAALISRGAALIPDRRRTPANFSLPSAHTKFHPLKLHSLSPLSKSRISASSSLPSPENPNPARDSLSGPTRTASTLAAMALTASNLVNAAGQLKEPLVNMAVGPAFFAAAKFSTSSGSLNTPLTLVAAGMAKWLDIYSMVLTVRCMLSWFPNIPWEKQPLVALRDLCDPYLNLFRNIIPPLFDALDVSPLFAFAVLGVLGSILKSSIVPV